MVIQEVTSRDGDSVAIKRAESKGRNIRCQGFDFKAGDLLLEKGRRLNARDVALAGAMNHAKVPVHRRPRLAVLATGDELVEPGTPPAPGQIVHSNGIALAAVARGEGADAIDFGIVPDRLDATGLGERVH